LPKTSNNIEYYYALDPIIKKRVVHVLREKDGKKYLISMVTGHAFEFRPSKKTTKTKKPSEKELIELIANLYKVNNYGVVPVMIFAVAICVHILNVMKKMEKERIKRGNSYKSNGREHNNLRKNKANV